MFWCDGDVAAADRIGSTDELCSENARVKRPRRTEVTEDRFRHIVYVYAHDAARPLLNYLRRRLSDYRDVLVVGCGKHWHVYRGAGETHSALGDNANVMRICQFAQGHGIVAAGAGASGEAADMMSSFGTVSTVVLPMASQHEQATNALEMKRTFGDGVFLAAREAGFDMGSPGSVLNPFLHRVATSSYLDAVGATPALRSLTSKKSASKHAADLLTGAAEPTSKERTIMAFSELVHATGVAMSLKQLRRKLKGFFQVTWQAKMLLQSQSTVKVDLLAHRFTVNECSQCIGKRETTLDVFEAADAILELEAMFYVLEVESTVLKKVRRDWKRLLSGLASFQGVGSGTSHEAWQSLQDLAESLDSLAEHSSVLF